MRSRIKSTYDLIKGCQLAMHSAVLLTEENNELRAANEKQKQNST